MPERIEEGVMCRVEVKEKRSIVRGYARAEGRAADNLVRWDVD
jgi:hypothetical protein